MTDKEFELLNEIAKLCRVKTKWRAVKNLEDCFQENMSTREGVLHYTEDAKFSMIIHEICHIAIVPISSRKHITCDSTVSYDEMYEEDNLSLISRTKLREETVIALSYCLFHKFQLDTFLCVEYLIHSHFSKQEYWKMLSDGVSENFDSNPVNVGIYDLFFLGFFESVFDFPKLTNYYNVGKDINFKN